MLWVFQLRALEFDIYDRTFNRQAPVWQPHLTRCPSNATGIPWILNKLEPSAIAPVCLQAGQNTGSPLRATSSCWFTKPEPLRTFPPVVVVSPLRINFFFFPLHFALFTPLYFPLLVLNARLLCPVPRPEYQKPSRPAQRNTVCQGCCRFARIR